MTDADADLSERGVHTGLDRQFNARNYIQVFSITLIAKSPARLATLAQEQFLCLRTVNRRSM